LAVIFAGSVSLLLLLRLLAAQNGSPAASETAFGLRTTTFQTPHGKILVNTPDDAAAGDALSGTVVADPAGRTDKEKAKNEDELNGYVVEVQNQKTQVGKKLIKWTAPAAPGVAFLILRERGGKEVSRASVPIQPNPITTGQPATPALTDFHLPNIGQGGRPVTIWGPFDGNASTTAVTIDDNPATVLAESPRKAVVQSPTSAVGPVAIHLRKGNTQATGVLRNLAVRLTAPRTNLRRGEETTLTVEVRGLKEIEADIPLSLTNHSEAVVTLGGGEQQNIVIRPRDVGPAGEYSMTRTLVGRQLGPYNLIAVVSEPTPAYLYHGTLLDRDFNPLTNVPPDIVSAFYRDYGNPPILLDEKPAPKPPPVSSPETPPERKKTAYMRDCEDAAVPLPPVWGDPGWKKQEKDLPKDKTFVNIKGQDVVEVWIYESVKPPGICYALPRKDSSGTILALGMICQGESGSACFWDNKGADGRTKIPVSPGLDPANMADGRNLVEKCVDCHRGDNAFIITPKTPLQVDAKPGEKDPPTDLPFGKRPYKPIDGPKDAPRPGWTSQPGDLDLEPFGCGSCHSIPALTKQYCSIMNQMVVKAKTMPPPPNDASKGDFPSDLEKIKKTCEATGYTWIEKY
jgi:hypothetical protein